MTKNSARIAVGALLVGSLAFGGLALADARSDAIAKANKGMADEAERFNRESKFKFALEVDWPSVKDFTEYNALNWGKKCGDFISTMRPLCISSESGKGVATCSDYVNKTVKKLVCSVIDDASKERVELKGTTLTWYMASGSESTARENVPKTLRALLPGATALKLQSDIDGYLAIQDGYKSAKMTADAPSFAGSEIESLSGLATYCVPAWDFLSMVNHPECQLKACKGDTKKKQAFLDGAKQLRCVHSKDPKAAEKKGDTLVFYTGEWASSTGSYDGIPWNAYNQLRSKLKLRDCGVDDRSTDPRGGGGVMISAARKICCPKGSDAKCASVKYEKNSVEVCKPVGLTTEKTCWSRDIIDKKALGALK